MTVNKSEYGRRYYLKNKERINARNNANYDANRDLVAERGREYRESKKEEISARRRRYRNENREKINAQCAEYRQANRDLINQKNADRRQKRRLNGDSNSSGAVKWRKRIESGIENPVTGRYSAAEDAILLRDDISLTEMCHMLKRKYPSVSSRRNRLLNPDSVRETSRRNRLNYYAKNRELIIKKQAEYQRANSQRINAYQRKRYAEMVARGQESRK